MNPPSSDSALRTVAGRYQLREVLGRGGMGTVWLAEDLLLRREVALKELLFPDTLEAEQQDELRQRSLREAQAAARISSPHAVKVYDVVTDGGRPWIVMERHHGRTLSEIIRADGPRSPVETARIGLAILAALENAHAAGIVHRDVKPSNVLVRSDGHVTLTDFGIARGIQDSTITRTGMIVGSPAYVAPERATGAPALPPSDLWALGATLFTTVEGHPPYDRGDPMQTLAAVMYGEPEPCRAAGPLAPVIHALLAKNPADRPTIPAARSLLTTVANSTAGTATLPVDGAVHIGDRTVLLPSGPGAGTAGGPSAVPVPSRPAALTPDLAPPATLPPELAPGAVRQRPPLRSTPPVAPPRRQRRRGTRSGVVLVVLALLAAASALFVATRDRPAAGDAAQQRTPSSTPAARTSSRAALNDGGAGGAGTSSPQATAERSQAPGSSSPSAGDDGQATGQGTGKDSGKDEGDDKASDKPDEKKSDESSGTPAKYTDPKVGWSINKPAQWRVRQRGSLTDLVDPATGAYLRIDSTGNPKPSAVGAWQEYEPAFAGRHPGYARIGMESTSWRDFDDVADWEYTYGQGAGRFHAINRGIVTGGRGYALNFQTRDSQWDASQGLMKELFESFRPAGT